MKVINKQNSKHKIPNTNKGITLLALVITIIVMLILVAVTISMAVNGGLFDYAGKATGDTQNAINAEQKLANLENNMTVDELIDKYTGETEGVDLSLVNVGDYISNYPVNYANVATHYSVSNNNTCTEKGGAPGEEFTGWRILSKETDEDGNVLYVKLVSAGVPINYYYYNNVDGMVENLTTNFLTTEINSSTLTQNKFYKCGFANVTGTTLASTFSNKFTDKVQALTKADIDKAVLDFGGSKLPSSGDLLGEDAYKDLLVVPCTKTDYGSYASIILATDYGDGIMHWMTHYGGKIYEDYHENMYGVRPVVSLKPDVKFTPATEKINDTTTWNISL